MVADVASSHGRGRLRSSARARPPGPSSASLPGESDRLAVAQLRTTVPASASTRPCEQLSASGESHTIPPASRPSGPTEVPKGTSEPPCDERRSLLLRHAIFGSTVLPTPDRDSVFQAWYLTAVALHIQPAPIPRFGQSGTFGYRKYTVPCLRPTGFARVKGKSSSRSCPLSFPGQVLSRTNWWQDA